MMDYRGWVGRACRFVADFRRAHPGMRAEADPGRVATAERLAEAEREIGRPLPGPLREFLLTASAEFDFRYGWEPRDDDQAAAAEGAFGTSYIAGGIECFCDLRYMADDYRLGCRDVLELVVSGWGEAPCEDPLPIGDLANGDYLVLDLAIRGGDSPVIYLGHDSDSYVMAPDFDAFLAGWEAICYLAPDLERPYEQFVDKGGRGLLTDETPSLARLRALLRPAS